MASLIALGHYALRVFVAHNARARVDLDVLTGFGVDEPGKSNVRQLPLARIVDSDCNDVVTLRENLQRMLDILGHKIRDEEDDRLLLESPREVIDNRNEVGSFPCGLERQQVAHDSKIGRASCRE